MSKARILYVEDDETLGYLTSDNLQLRGFEVLHCSNGKVALEAFRENKVDICILDIMLPHMDGFELASSIRSINDDVPIIFLTAKTLSEDKIKGLTLGADDYIVKPFNVEELVLKIKIFLKRSKVSTQEEKIYEIGSFQFDYTNLELKNGSYQIIMTKREADLLRYFTENKNQVLKREKILQALWGDDDYFMGRSLDVFISRLRKHLSHDQNLSIENIHSIGFRLNEK